MAEIDQTSMILGALQEQNKASTAAHDKIFTAMQEVRDKVTVLHANTESAHKRIDGIVLKVDQAHDAGQDWFRTKKNGKSIFGWIAGTGITAGIAIGGLLTKIFGGQ